MGATIYLATYFGGLLDEHQSLENNSFKTLFTILGVAASMYLFIRQAQKLNDD